MLSSTLRCLVTRQMLGAIALIPFSAMLFALQAESALAGKVRIGGQGVTVQVGGSDRIEVNQSSNSANPSRTVTGIYTGSSPFDQVEDFYSEDYYDWDNGGRNHDWRDGDRTIIHGTVVDSTLINPTLINSTVVESTLINPVIIDTDPYGTTRVTTRRSPRIVRSSSCTLFIEQRAACQ